MQVNAKKSDEDRADLPALRLFNCPMAKPYGKWLQTESEISNPYMGRSMPRCGKLVELVGGPRDERFGCPTHSEVTAHEPGKCSECGAELRKRE